MNSAHDLGGRHGFGPIAPEAENSEPVFHEDWERKALALVLAAGSLDINCSTPSVVKSA